MKFLENKKSHLVEEAMMLRNGEEEIFLKLNRCTAVMRSSVDRISRNVSALQRINTLLDENLIPISKNLKVKDLKAASDYLRHYGPRFLQDSHPFPAWSLDYQIKGS